MKSSTELELALARQCDARNVTRRTEKNPYLKVSYAGAGKLIPKCWNVKIYTTGSVVCTDYNLLHQILLNQFKEPDSTKTVVRCDDSMWGFPLLGVMVGVCIDEDEPLYGVVDVRHFRKELYSADHVADEYCKAGLMLLPDTIITPDKYRIEICSGYVNRKLAQELRNRGFDVSVTVITGKLQDGLEKAAREYVKRVCGADIYYDPKECADGGEIAFRYKQAVEYGKKYCPSMLKNGWKALSNN